jgi:hypothetical protein
LVYKLILTGFACRGNRFCYSSFIFANYNFTLSSPLVRLINGNIKKPELSGFLMLLGIHTAQLLLFLLL